MPDTSKTAPRRPAHAIAVAVTVLALAGCATNLDMVKLKQAIIDKLTEVEIKTKSVDCPAERPAKKDDAFQCTVTTDNDVKVTVDVKQKDDQGNIGFDVGKQVFTSVKVVPELENGLRSNQAASVVKVTCPKAIAITDGNGTLTCEAIADDAKYTIKVPIKDGTAQLNDEEITEG